MRREMGGESAREGSREGEGSPTKGGGRGVEGGGRGEWGEGEVSKGGILERRAAKSKKREEGEKYTKGSYDERNKGCFFLYTQYAKYNKQRRDTGTSRDIIYNKKKPLSIIVFSSFSYFSFYSLSKFIFIPPSNPPSPSCPTPLLPHPPPHLPPTCRKISHPDIPHFIATKFSQLFLFFKYKNNKKKQ